jgi:hypothetical protein
LGVLGQFNDDRQVLTKSSQAARTLAAALFTEDVDVENIILKFNKGEVRTIKTGMNSLNTSRPNVKQTRSRFRVYTLAVDVEKREQVNA